MTYKALIPGEVIISPPTKLRQELQKLLPTVDGARVAWSPEGSTLPPIDTDSEGGFSVFDQARGCYYVGGLSALGATIAKIDATTGEVLAITPTRVGPSSVFGGEINPAGTKLLVLSDGSETISQVDLATMTEDTLTVDVYTTQSYDHKAFCWLSDTEIVVGEGSAGSDGFYYYSINEPSGTTFTQGAQDLQGGNQRILSIEASPDRSLFAVTTALNGTVIYNSTTKAVVQDFSSSDPIETDYLAWIDNSRVACYNSDSSVGGYILNVDGSTSTFTGLLSSFDFGDSGTSSVHAVTPIGANGVALVTYINSADRGLPYTLYDLVNDAPVAGPFWLPLENVVGSNEAIQMAVAWPEDVQHRIITGTVNVEGSPAARRVVAVHKESETPLFETVSDASDGSYSLHVFTTDDIRVVCVGDGEELSQMYDNVRAS